ncbi:GlxA family transcriptional regulator [Rhodoligotrophos defluvii]|uniref:GlxA family transcriptional regulator n=1 Tax=Rhodoligotrophos defluvii TaxID=2561934 RepID=UPI0010C994AE|nr:helix-turn-helix domain-containing protein [Rhodoligotrophos defluvii]
MYKIAFLLLPEYQLLGVVSALETLRVANSLYPQPRFEAILVHDTSAMVASSSGIPLQAHCHIRDLREFDALIVCSSFKHDKYENGETQNLIRRFARHGKAIGSVESGVYHIAKAGVLNGYTATAHFNNLPLFAQLFPEVKFVKKVYTWCDKRMTCAGGSACIDMMLHLVTATLGNAVAARVANIIIHPYRRDLWAPLDDIFTSAYNGLPSTVREACRIMEDAIQEPLKVEDIAAQLGVSRRHLDRMFCHSLKCSTSDYYRMIRLSRARKLVKATKIDLSTISTRCGFYSYSHFLQRYREAYGVSPTEDRFSHTITPTEPSQVSPLNDLHPYQNQLDPIRMI